MPKKFGAGRAAVFGGGFQMYGVTLAAATTDWLDAPSTNMGAATDDIMASVWFRRTVSGTSEQLYASDNAGRWTLAFESDDEINVGWSNNASTLFCRIIGPNPPTVADTSWHHIMWSCHNNDSALAGGTAYIEAYLDGVEITTGTFQETIGTDNFEPQARGHDIGDNFAGDFSQFWVNNEAVDLSSAATRAKFYNSGPVDFGPTGANPTGSQPFLYLLFEPGALGTNSGTGSDFTEIGTVINSVTTPVD